MQKLEWLIPRKIIDNLQTPFLEIDGKLWASRFSWRGSKKDYVYVAVDHMGISREKISQVGITYLGVNCSCDSPEPAKVTLFNIFCELCGGVINNDRVCTDT